MNEFLVLVAVLMIIVGLAIPGILRERNKARNEALAIETLRRLAALQQAYARGCGSGGYASGFSQLDPTVLPQRDGYRFALREGEGTTGVDCHGLPTYRVYILTAQPTDFGTTGSRSFSATSENTIWETNASTAPEQPFGRPAERLE